MPRKGTRPKKTRPPQIEPPLPGPAPDLMIPREGAGYIRQAQSFLYEWSARADDPTRARNGGLDPIPVLRMGRVLRYRKQDLDDWMNRRASNASPAKVAAGGKR